MVYTVWLAATCANLYIMGETSLSVLEKRYSSNDHTYPHSSMQSSCDLVILFQPWTASKNLWQPELSHCSFHMSNLSLRWRGCLDPLRWLSSDTAHHIGVGEGLGGSLLRLDIER